VYFRRALLKEAEGLPALDEYIGSLIIFFGAESASEAPVMLLALRIDPPLHPRYELLGLRFQAH
jgi:hypothetical protein